MIRAALVGALLALALAPRGASAGQATCSNPGLPVGATSSRDLMPGQLTLSLTSSILPVTNEQVLVEQQGNVRYDTAFVVADARLSAEYTLTKWIAVSAALPYRLIDIDVARFDPATGMPLPEGGSIHARTEQLRGLGDLQLLAHTAREIRRTRVHLRAGMTLPTGETVDEDPFLLGQIGQEHQHIQLGTGTVVPFLGVEVQRAAGPVTLAGFALAYASLYANHHGYRAGTRISGGLSAASGLGTKQWTVNIGADVHGETAERWNDRTYTDEGNSGRLDILVGGGVAFRPSPRWAITGELKVPAYSHRVGNQVAYTLIAGLGVIGTFDLGGGRASYRGADAREVAAPGTAADLAPVPGKITVFDLWATWCAPCRELDAALAELARAHPERLAIRKLDVVDPDSAAWTRHLAPGQFELPHVKVYGADGVLRFERSAPPAELVRAIRALLAQGTAQVPR